ncbi:MAG: hypothetical protein ACLUWN_01080 [Clostridia bacterium]|jgi:hypothetical protein|nr:MAG TPA: hypothetical protein [Caudoviricetes sp.]DAP13685.1 MAG TPA: hypothetical protein [Caudoviricetes sp.]
MSEPLILVLKKEIEKRKANMTTYYGKSQIYNHLSSNIEERVWMNKYEDNGIGYLSHGTDGVLIEKNVKHINIKANALVRLNNNDQNGDVFISIRKNGISIAEGNFYQQGYAPYTYSIFRNYVEVKEGDLIQLYVAGQNMEINILDSENSRSTQLYVEVVD